MNSFTLKFWLALGSLVTLTNNLSAAEQVADASSIPEPSAALLGGLCGVIFLLWRKK
ncbi:MAG: hypothetical protein QNK82_05200 [Akkermansiaceae bacterium]|nr:hypothetical protein [Akkermansiaceae bacterium]